MSVRQSRGRFIVDTYWPDGVRTRLVMRDEKAASDRETLIQASLINVTWRELRERLTAGLDRALLFKAFRKVYLREYVATHNRSKSSAQGLATKFLTGSFPNWIREWSRFLLSSERPAAGAKRL